MHLKVMHSEPRARVNVALALHLGGAPSKLERAMRLEEDLGLDPLDLILIALRIEEGEERDHGEVPLARLETLRTVADLDAIVESWLAESVRAA